MTDTEPKILGGRYEIGALIGRGGMAEVHLGHDLRLGRTVAIKLLRTDLARDVSFLARFRREAQAAAGLSHPSIVAVYDSGEETGFESGGAQVALPYIVMEYVDGQTLRDILNVEGALEPDEAARIAAGLLAALSYSHERGIVHRDVKPANIMVTPGGAVKVMDFGIARAIADSAATMTQTQAVIGTARYISPEQAQGEPVDARSDVYSAGCLFYELLTGRTPFVGDPVSLVYQHLGEQAPAPSQFREDLPYEYEAIALHALEKTREDRYQSAAAMRADLQAARAGRPISPPAQATLDRVLALEAAGDDDPPEPAATAAVAAGSTEVEEERDNTAEIPTDAPDRRRRRSMMLLVALLLAALAGLGYFAWQGAQEDAPQQVSVPPLAGTTEDQARTLLERSGLHAQFVRQPSNEVTEGVVISSDPPDNTNVDTGSTIQVLVSSGKSSAVVPELVGKELREAQTLLSEAGLSLGGVTTTDDPKVKGGSVVSSNPKAGSTTKPGTAVTLVVSSGKVKVPDVSGKSLNDAQAALAAVGLQPTVTFEETDQADPDTVTRQGTAPGTAVDQGSKVEIVVARAKSVPTTSVVTQTITQPPVPTGTTPPPPRPRPAPSTSTLTPEPPSPTVTATIPEETTSQPTITTYTIPPHYPPHYPPTFPPPQPR